MAYLLHLTDLGRWLDAETDIDADSLHTEGFVHASPDEPTVLAVANSRYSGAKGQQVVLVIDPGRLEAQVRWEAPSPAPPPGVDAGVLFPHIYGPIPRAAVAEVRYLRRDPDGTFTRVERRSATAELLDLLPHPEGGWYRPTWRTGVGVHPSGYPGERPTATGICFLLGPGERSRWHRVRSDEVWAFNRGGELEISLGGTGERPAAEQDRSTRILGPRIEAGHALQVLVPAGTWQTARPAACEETLVSCFVSPGFDFADFETAAD